MKKKYNFNLIWFDYGFTFELPTNSTKNDSVNWAWSVLLQTDQFGRNEYVKNRQTGKTAKRRHKLPGNRLVDALAYVENYHHQCAPYVCTILHTV